MIQIHCKYCWLRAVFGGFSGSYKASSYKPSPPHPPPKEKKEKKKDRLFPSRV